MCEKTQPITSLFEATLPVEDCGCGGACGDGVSNFDANKYDERVLEECGSDVYSGLGFNNRGKRKQQYTHCTTGIKAAMGFGVPVPESEKPASETMRKIGITTKGKENTIKYLGGGVIAVLVTTLIIKLYK
jgi:hypothetical protein